MELRNDSIHKNLIHHSLAGLFLSYNQLSGGGQLSLVYKVVRSYATYARKIEETYAPDKIKIKGEKKGFTLIADSLCSQDLNCYAKLDGYTQDKNEVAWKIDQRMANGT